MGLFESTQSCPVCHWPQARKSWFGGRVRCPNPDCPNFEAALQGASGRVAAPKPASRARKAAPFPAGEKLVTIRYRNFRGEEKRFEADPLSLRIRNAHVSARVAPTGRRIALKKDSIGNRDEVLALAAKVPTGVDRKILTYHLLRGTTSERFEEVRRRYPDW